MGWITTKSGKRVNTDWFDADEANKQRHIEENKKEAEDKNAEDKQLTRKEKEEQWNKKVDEYIGKMIDNTQVKPSKPTKMSQSIFKSSFYDALKDVKKGDISYTALSNLTGYDKENDYINSKQTMGGIQSLINDRISSAKMDFRLGVINNEEFNQEIKALRILQKTLNNIKKEKDW